MVVPGQYTIWRKGHGSRGVVTSIQTPNGCNVFCAYQRCPFSKNMNVNDVDSQEGKVDHYWPLVVQRHVPLFVSRACRCRCSSLFDEFRWKYQLFFDVFNGFQRKLLGFFDFQWISMDFNVVMDFTRKNETNKNLF